MDPNAPNPATTPDAVIPARETDQSTDFYDGFYHVIGPPGTGKTTFLSRQVATVVDRYGAAFGDVPWSNPVLICSLTKAAAAEVGGRDLPIKRRMVGTLHAHCYRALDRPKIVEGTNVSDWNEHAPEDWCLQGDYADIGETPAWERTVDGTTASRGDEILGRIDVLRHRCIPQDKWPGAESDFYEAWAAWKTEQCVLDFTDLIEQALLTVWIAPGNPNVIMVDEAQDLSTLEYKLIRKWSESANATIIVGDPWQCQPAGTMVRTSGHGLVPIEDLDPLIHKLISFDRRSSLVSGIRMGRAFKKASRIYRGRMIRVSGEGFNTECTPNHKWTVKIVDDGQPSWMCYLMRRGDWWRVGVCKTFRSGGSMGVRFRMYQERGEEVWVLGIHTSAADAQVQEAIVSCKYGIPQTCFETASHKVITDEHVAQIFTAVAGSPAKCLKDHGLEGNHPFVVTSSADRVGRRTPTEVHACNLIPRIMRLPVPTIGKRFEWREFSARSRNNFSGYVFSLDVVPHQHYISDGVITHNSLYAWRGADPKLFEDESVEPSHRRILHQSYRLPRRVLHASVQWVKRGLSDYYPIEYKPRTQLQQGEEEPEGEIGTMESTLFSPEAIVELCKFEIAEGRTVMIQASCAYMLRTMISNLRSAGVPFANPWRSWRGDWNPLGGSAPGTTTAERALAFVRPCEDMADARRGWTYKDMKLWTSNLAVRANMKRGAKQKIVDCADGDAGDDYVNADLIDEWFEAEMLVVLKGMQAGNIKSYDALCYWHVRLLGKTEVAARFAVDVVHKHGPRGLMRDPQVYVGTIHSFKGGEADVAVVFPDLSTSGFREWQTAGDGRDSIIRLFYVAMTRARERLFVCAPQDTNCAPLRRHIREILEEGFGDE